MGEVTLLCCSLRSGDTPVAGEVAQGPWWVMCDQAQGSSTQQVTQWAVPSPGLCHRSVSGSAGPPQSRGVQCVRGWC